MNKIKITNKLVEKFADQSGDFNPIHLNENYSVTSLYGKRIAHGALVLNLILRKFLEKNKIVINLKCFFINPIYINDHLFIIKKTNGRNIEIAVKNKNSNLVLKIFYKYIIKKDDNFCEIETSNLKFPSKVYSRNIFDIKKNLKKKKKLFLYSKKKLFKSRENLELCINTISREIGMNFPGKRSLFINCEFKLLKNSISKKNYFKIKEFDQLISKLNIEYNIGKYFVKTNSLLLPFPKKNITTKKKLTILKKNSLSVLVLGGSRGLGLLTTRLLLNSNFRVYSTFNNYDKNLKDLKKIFKNRIKIIKCDILKLKDQRKIFSNISKFNFIFNFTSCKILKTSGKFNKDYYNLLNKYYLNPIKFFFKKIRNSKSKTKFFSPSTIYIEDKEKKNNFKEYVKAKANTEKLIKKLNNKSNKIFYYFRFDEYDTDQQYSLFPKKIINDINSFVKVIDLFINTKK